MSAEIAKALAAFQAEAPTVSKGKTAKVPTKSGGSYSYTYANLADVVEAAYPLLSKHGLSFSCVPRPTERGYELAGVLLHVSGEKLEGSLPLSGGTPQELGSALTYMRRYLLGAMTGLVTDDDDDGAASQRPASRQEARPDTGEVATEAQQRAMHAAARARSWTRDDLMDRLSRQFERRITSAGELTKREASEVLDKLKEDR